MISVSELKTKAQHKYKSYLEAIARDKDIFPLDMSVNKKPSGNLANLQQEIEALIAQSKPKIGYGYQLGFKTVHTRKFGTQDLPTRIYFDTENDFLQFITKQNEVVIFKKNLPIIRSEFPELSNWTIQHPQKIIKHAHQWNDLLKVCRYFKENPYPNLYIRELPIKIHTKFIENNKGIIRELLNHIIPNDLNPDTTNFEQRFHLKSKESLVRFRILDTKISEQYFLGVNDLSVPVSQFAKLQLPVKKVIISENLITFLTLPPMPDTLAIFGKGFDIGSLKNVDLLHTTAIFYWSDIDVHGFQMLSQIRKYYPHTRSFLMDKTTFDTFYEGGKGTPTTQTHLDRLTPEEHDLYDLLQGENLRLEQEHILHGYVVGRLEKTVYWLSGRKNLNML